MEQLEVLDALGCEAVEGYLHSPAVPAEEIDRPLAACQQHLHPSSVATKLDLRQLHLPCT